MLEAGLLKADGGGSVLGLLDAGATGTVLLPVPNLEADREVLLVGGAGLVSESVLVPHLVIPGQLIDKAHWGLLLDH